MEQNRFIMLMSGTGGVGKRTLIQGLLSRDDIKLISSFTTRERRETDTIDRYQYISKDEFEEKIKSGEIFEYDIFNNSDYYGTSKSLFKNAIAEKPVVLKDISVLGYANCKEALSNDYNIISVFITEKKSVIKQRLIDRGERKDRIKNRLAIYKKEQSHADEYDFLIKNSNYNRSIDKLNAIIDYGVNGDIIYPTKNYTKLIAKKIDRYAARFATNKKIKPIKVALIDGKIYIVDGVHRYLAALKTGKNVVKRFVEMPVLKFDFDKDEWRKIVESYDIKRT